MVGSDQVGFFDSIVFLDIPERFLKSDPGLRLRRFQLQHTLLHHMQLVFPHLQGLSSFLNLLLSTLHDLNDPISYHQENREFRTHILQLVDLSPSFQQLFSPFTGNLFDLLVMVSDLDVQLFVQLLDLGVSPVDIEPRGRELIPQLVDPLDTNISRSHIWD